MTARTKLSREQWRSLAAVIICTSAVGTTMGQMYPISPVALWPSLFLLGMAAGGIWTVSLVLAGQLSQGASLAAALALKGVLYGIGSVTGPPAAGAALAHWGQIALTLVLALTPCSACCKLRGSIHRLRLYS